MTCHSKSPQPPFIKGQGGIYCRGLSLLEVLVAFSILAIALSVLLRVFATGLSSAAVAEAHSQAVLWAESLLSQSGIEAPLEVGEQSGSFNERYHWRRVVRPYPLNELPEESSLPLTPLEVTAQVFWEESGKRHSVTLTTLRLVSRSQEEQAQQSFGLGGNP